MKLDDEQLSRVLSAHEDSNLARKGCFPSLGKHIPCLYQAAFNAADTVELVDLGMNSTYPGLRWFDRNYNPAWNTEQFIKELTEQEII